MGWGKTASLASDLGRGKAFCCFLSDSQSQKCLFGKLAIFILPVFAAIISFQFPFVFSKNLSENTSYLSCFKGMEEKVVLSSLGSTVERVTVALEDWNGVRGRTSWKEAPVDGKTLKNGVGGHLSIHPL